MEQSGAGARIKSLDITRGVAVMGILSVNIVGMAMIQSAYFYPPADGWDGLADRLMWLGNFLLVDGKLRSLFSMMFGASTLLVIERAIATGRSPARTHYARMIVLLGIGYLHWWLFWWGDILTHYAAVGMLLFLFRKAKPKLLFILAGLALLLQGLPGLIMTPGNIARYERIQAGEATPKELEQVAKSRERLYPGPEALAEDDAAHESIPAHAHAIMEEGGPLKPFELGPLWFETLGLMLLGMALYKNGFLTGSLYPATYRKVALYTVPAGLLVYAAAAGLAIAKDHAPPYQFASYGGFTALLRPVVAVGYAALIILACRRGQSDGWWSRHFAAVGRTAFSNYLFSTFVGTLLFFGFAGDLFLKLSRFEAWLLVPPMWLAMLLWSKWWLDRFHYGPLEWIWRSLATGTRQPLRRAASTGE